MCVCVCMSDCVSPSFWVMFMNICTPTHTRVCHGYVDYYIDLYSMWLILTPSVASTQAYLRYSFVLFFLGPNQKQQFENVHVTIQGLIQFLVTEHCPCSISTFHNRKFLEIQSDTLSGLDGAVSGWPGTDLRTVSVWKFQESRCIWLLLDISSCFVLTFNREYNSYERRNKVMHVSP